LYVSVVEPIPIRVTSLFTSRSVQEEKD